MSKADKGNAEPSMEEILASIRRIISDDKEDDVPVETPVADAPTPVAKPAAPQTNTPKPTDMPIQPPVAASPPALVDPAATAAPSVAPEMPPAAPEVVHVPDMPPQEGAEEMELTEILDDEPMVDLPGVEPAPAQTAPEVVAAIVDEVFEPAAPPAATAADTAIVVSDAAEQVPVTDYTAPSDHERSLVSPPVRALSTNMLADLAGAIHARGFVLGNVSMTLEDLIRDLMRPHLKDWLDKNLPGIVERMVRAEIERMVREAEARKDLI